MPIHENFLVFFGGLNDHIFIRLTFFIRISPVFTSYSSQQKEEIIELKEYNLFLCNPRNLSFISLQKKEKVFLLV